MPEDRHEGVVGQTGRFQVRQLVGGEEAAKGGQGQARLPMGQGAKHHFHALIAVVVLVPRGAALALAAQCGEAVGLPVELAGGGCALGGVEQIAVLRHHQKDEPIHQAQEFIEPVRQGDVAGFQLAGQIMVGAQESGTQHLEGLPHLARQTVPGGFPKAGAGLTPMLQRTIRCRSAGAAKTAAVNQQPERREGGSILSGEHPRQIGLDVGRAGEGGIVPQQPHPAAVGHQAPEGMVMVVEPILEGKGGGAGPIRGEGGAAALQLLPWRRHHHGNPIPGKKGHNPIGWGKIMEAEGLSQKLPDKALRGGQGRLLAPGKLIPVGLAHPESRGDLLANRQPFADAVAGAGGGVVFGGANPGQHGGGDEVALQAEGGPDPHLGGRLTGHGAQASGVGRRSKIRSSFSFKALLSALTSALKSCRSCRCLASLAAMALLSLASVAVTSILTASIFSVSLVSVAIISSLSLVSTSLISPFRDWKPATPTLTRAITSALMMAPATTGSNH